MNAAVAMPRRRYIDRDFVAPHRFGQVFQAPVPCCWPVVAEAGDNARHASAHILAQKYQTAWPVDAWHVARDPEAMAIVDERI